MLDLKATVTEAANHLKARVAHVAVEALDAVVAKASNLLLGVPAQPRTQAAAAPRPVAAHGKAAAKKRKQARLSMQRLVKAAKRSAS
jgi:hypothetical protein